MEALYLEETDETPGIKLDSEKNIFEFIGKSLPEDVATFYNPILDWLDEYSKNLNDTTEVVFKLDYFNTASSKMILDVLLKLEEFQESGKAVKVKWYYAEDDEDMEDAGNEYSEIVDVPFEFESYN
ncbi:MAG TPA: nuclear pore complex subunit [Flavobacteriales bacterium]|nr:nuclear pore complex subunit [Flavobacteriales bacterium]